MVASYLTLKKPLEKDSGDVFQRLLCVYCLLPSLGDKLENKNAITAMKIQLYLLGRVQFFSVRQAEGGNLSNQHLNDKKKGTVLSNRARLKV